MILPPRLLSGTAVSSIGRIVGTLCSIGTIAVITRSLAAAHGGEIFGYGLYATILAYVTILAILADGGLYTLFTRDAARAESDEKELLELLWRTRMIWSSVILVLGIAAAFFLPYPGIVRAGIAIGAVGVAFQLGSQLLLGVFQKRLRLATPALAEVAGRATQLGGSIIVAFVHPSILGFVFVFVIGAGVTFCWNIIGAKKFVPFRILGGPAGAYARSIFFKAWPIAASLVLSLMFFKVDSIMLSLMKPPEDVAVYVLPFRVLESLLFFPAAIGGMLLPVFSRASSSGPQGISAPLRAATDVYMVFAIPLAAFLFMGAPWIVTFLAGASFIESVSVLRILAIALGALFIGNLFGNAIIAIHAHRKLFIISLILTILNIGANLVLIPPYSFMGAAWATLGTQLVSVMLAAYILLASQVSIFGTSSTPKILLSGTLLISILFLPISSLYSIPLAIMGYILALFFSGAVSSAQIFSLLRAQKKELFYE